MVRKFTSLKRDGFFIGTGEAWRFTLSGCRVNSQPTETIPLPASGPQCPLARDLLVGDSKSHRMPFMAPRVNGSLNTTLMDHPDYRRGDPRAPRPSPERRHLTLTAGLAELRVNDEEKKDMTFFFPLSLSLYLT